MKKVSTVAGQQSRNISRPRLTIGLDLGDRNSWYCMMDEAGQIRLERRVGTNASVAGSLRRHAALPGRAGNRDAFAVDQPFAARVGTRSDCGERAPGAADRVQRSQRRINLTPTGLLMEGVYTH